VCSVCAKHLAYCKKHMIYSMYSALYTVSVQVSYYNHWEEAWMLLIERCFYAIQESMRDKSAQFWKYFFIYLPKTNMELLPVISKPIIGLGRNLTHYWWITCDSQSEDELERLYCIHSYRSPYTTETAPLAEDWISWGREGGATVVLKPVANIFIDCRRVCA
jgi:hypothetical protein